MKGVTPTSPRGRQAVLATIIGLLLLSACSAPGGEPLPLPSPGISVPIPDVAEPDEPAFRALAEPIAAWACDDLIPLLEGESDRAASTTSPGTPSMPTVGVDGEIRCAVDVIIVEDSAAASVAVTVTVADLEDQIEAEAVLRDAVCCYQGDLVVDSDPPQRSTCGGGICAASVAINGFVGSVLYQWLPGELPEAAQGERLASSTAQLSSLLREAPRPLPLEPLNPDAAPFTRCDSVPDSVSAAMGLALGSGVPARAEYGGSGDGLWIQAALDARRGTTFCQWTADDAGSAASVAVTPGAGPLVGRADAPLDTAGRAGERGAFAVAVDGNAIEVYGVDRATAEAIAEAHRR